MYKQSVWQGVSFYILHCLLFAVIAALVKTVIVRYHPAQILLIQTSCGFITVLFFLLFKKGAFKKLNIQHLKWHGLRALCWAIASVFYFYAIASMPLPKVVALTLSIPVFSSTIAWIILKESISMLKIFATITGIIGVSIIVQPDLSHFDFNSLLVIIACFFWAIANILTRILGRTQSAFTKAFLFMLFGGLFISAYGLSVWHPIELQDVNLFITLVVVFIVNAIVVARAYQLADVSFLDPLAFMQVIFSTIIGILFFNEIISGYTAIGTSIIFISSCLLVWYENKVHELRMWKESVLDAKDKSTTDIL